MTYRRWDIVFVRVDEKDATGHPAVVLSSDDVMADDKQQRFNVVTGTKKQPAENARNHHVISKTPAINIRFESGLAHKITNVLHHIARGIKAEVAGSCLV